MDKYQSIVYRCPGPHARAGGTFDYKGVASEAEEAALLKGGWFRTLPEAIIGKTPSAEGPPTRDELEQKARQLGISFDRKMPDAVLAKKIADTLVRDSC